MPICEMDGCEVAVETDERPCFCSRCDGLRRTREAQVKLDCMVELLEEDATGIAPHSPRDEKPRISSNAAITAVQLCVPASWSEDAILAWAHRHIPPSVEHLDIRWRLRRDDSPLLDGDEARVTCAERANVVHVVVEVDNELSSYEVQRRVLPRLRARAEAE